MKKLNGCIKIAVENIKGGVGKTTTSISVAGALVKRGFKVLIAEMDPQGSASSNLGRKGYQQPNMGYVLQGRMKAADVIKKTNVENLHILPADLKMLLIEDEIKALQEPEICLSKALSEVEHEYDFIIIDCSPYYNVYVANALLASDYVIVPVKLDKNSLEGYDLLTQMIQELKAKYGKGTEVLGILATMYRNANLYKELLDKLRASKMNKLLFNTYIRQNVSIEEAPFVNMPVIQYDEKSNSAEDYEAVTSELLERLGIEVNSAVEEMEVR